MIRPHRAVCIAGNTACVQLRTPSRFTASTRCQSSGMVSVKNPKWSMPALFTRTSKGPNSSTNARTISRSVTSRGRKPLAPLMSPTTTSCPAAASRCVIAVPIPPAPPVTSARRGLAIRLSLRHRLEPGPRRSARHNPNSIGAASKTVHVGDGKCPLPLCSSGESAIPPCLTLPSCTRIHARCAPQVDQSAV